MTISDDDLAELERLAEAATRLGIQCTEIQERLEDDDMLGLECADTVALERAMREQRHITISLASSVPALIAALREGRAELAATKRAKDEMGSSNDAYREVATDLIRDLDAVRLTLSNVGSERDNLLNHVGLLEAEVARLLSIIRRCRESVEGWAPLPEDDKALLADIAKVLEENDRGE